MPETDVVVATSRVGRVVVGGRPLWVPERRPVVPLECPVPDRDVERTVPVVVVAWSDEALDRWLPT